MKEESPPERRCSTSLSKALLQKILVRLLMPRSSFDKTLVHLFMSSVDMLCMFDCLAMCCGGSLNLAEDDDMDCLFHTNKLERNVISSRKNIIHVGPLRSTCDTLHVSSRTHRFACSQTRSWRISSLRPTTSRRSRGSAPRNARSRRAKLLPRSQRQCAFGLAYYMAGDTGGRVQIAEFPSDFVSFKVTQDRFFCGGTVLH